jgi:hypothetical protein
LRPDHGRHWNEYQRGEQKRKNTLMSWHTLSPCKLECA